MATSKAIAAYRGAAPSSLRWPAGPTTRSPRSSAHKSRGSVSKALWKTIERRSAAAVYAYRERELQLLDALERAPLGKALSAADQVSCEISNR